HAAAHVLGTFADLLRSAAPFSFGLLCPLFDVPLHLAALGTDLAPGFFGAAVPLTGKRRGGQHRDQNPLRHLLSPLVSPRGQRSALVRSRRSFTAFVHGAPPRRPSSGSPGCVDRSPALPQSK